MREAFLKASGSASWMPGAPSSSMAMNLMRLEPMTAPRPPRPWLRILPDGSFTAMFAEVRRISPAGPMAITPVFLPRSDWRASMTAKFPRPRSPRSSSMVTPSLLTLRAYQPSPLGMPSTIRALMPRRANIWAAVPPTLLSLMPPVSGLLAPADRRPELDAAVPESSPGANTSLLLGPRAWQVGGTSFATMVDVRARPPRPAHSAGTSSTTVVRSGRFTRRILSMVGSPQGLGWIPDQGRRCAGRRRRGAILDIGVREAPADPVGNGKKRGSNPPDPPPLLGLKRYFLIIYVSNRYPDGTVWRDPRPDWPPEGPWRRGRGRPRSAGRSGTASSGRGSSSPGFWGPSWRPPGAAARPRVWTR